MFYYAVVTLFSVLITCTIIFTPCFSCSSFSNTFCIILCSCMSLQLGRLMCLFYCLFFLNLFQHSAVYWWACVTFLCNRESVIYFFTLMYISMSGRCIFIFMLMFIFPLLFVCLLTVNLFVPDFVMLCTFLCSREFTTFYYLCIYFFRWYRVRGMEDVIPTFFEVLL